MGSGPHRLRNASASWYSWQDKSVIGIMSAGSWIAYGIAVRGDALECQRLEKADRAMVARVHARPNHFNMVVLTKVMKHRGHCLPCIAAPPIFGKDNVGDLG